jgi:molecular chaperone GrpE (heat shock protein)
MTDQNRPDPASTEPSSSDPSVAESLGCEPHIDVDRLNEALATPILASIPAASAVTAGETDSLVKEIVEDMLHLHQRTKAIDEQSQQMLARLERLEALQAGTIQTLGGQIVALRQELASDLRASAVMNVARAVIPSIRQLHAVRAGLSNKKDKRFRNQVEAVATDLAAVLRQINCAPFEPQKGQLFDPAEMEVVDYAPGQPGVVLRVVYPGYRVGGCIISPAGVLIARPNTSYDHLKGKP